VASVLGDHAFETLSLDSRCLGDDWPREFCRQAERPAHWIPSPWPEAALILRAFCKFDQDQPSPRSWNDWGDCKSPSPPQFAYFASTARNRADGPPERGAMG